MGQMVQVNKDEYEMLTRFHPGEIRYYVDTGTQIRRNVGATVTVKHSSTTVTNGDTRPSRADSGVRVGSPNKPVQLTVKRWAYRAHSISQQIQRLVSIAMEDDPTVVMGRNELVSKIVATGRFKITQISPVISDLLKHGDLRYVGQAAAE